MINLFFNYYLDHRADRASELAACLHCNLLNNGFDRIFILANKEPAVLDSRVTAVQVSSRPSFGEIFDIMRRFSGPADVNVLLNSDCFVARRDTRKFRRIRQGQAYCVRRTELRSINPMRIDRQRHRRFARAHWDDSQDCWVLRGPPRGGMKLDFPMGKPGCDNRLAYELSNAGYEILDPCYSIRVFHLHRSANRDYQDVERVQGPYGYPLKCGTWGSAEWLRRRLWFRVKSAPNMVRLKLHRALQRLA